MLLFSSLVPMQWVGVSCAKTRSCRLVVLVKSVVLSTSNVRSGGNARSASPIPC